MPKFYLAGPAGGVLGVVGGIYHGAATAYHGAATAVVRRRCDAAQARR